MNTSSNSVKRPDRRRERTMRQLGSSLVALIPEKGYDNIRIEDIAEHANLGRATFYLHFKNKDELLYDVLKRLFQEAMKDNAAQQNDSLNKMSAISMAFQHANQYREFYRLLLQTKSVSGLNQQLLVIIAGQAEIRLKALLEANGSGPFSELKLQMATQYIASALYGLIVWWLRQDDAPDITEVSLTFQNLTQALIEEISHSKAP